MWPEKRRKSWIVVRDCDEKWQVVTEIPTKEQSEEIPVSGIQQSKTTVLASMAQPVLTPSQGPTWGIPTSMGNSSFIPIKTLHQCLLLFHPSTKVLPSFCPDSLRRCSRAEIKLRKCRSQFSPFGDYYWIAVPLKCVIFERKKSVEFFSIQFVKLIWLLNLLLFLSQEFPLENAAILCLPRVDCMESPVSNKNWVR
jgi:hypothetical protein